MKERVRRWNAATLQLMVTSRELSRTFDDGVNQQITQVMHFIDSFEGRIAQALLRACEVTITLCTIQGHKISPRTLIGWGADGFVITQLAAEGPDSAIPSMRHLDSHLALGVMIEHGKSAEDIIIAIQSHADALSHPGAVGAFIPLTANI